MSDTDSMSDVTDDSIEQAITPVLGINNNIGKIIIVFLQLKNQDQLQ